MNKKHKILVLSDVKGTMEKTLKNGVSLAKMIDADLHLFHVRKPTDIVNQESQLSAIRTINKSYIETGNEIKNLVDPITKAFDIKINYNHAFGNIKGEILKHIQELQPDIIVLEKRKLRPFSFIGDRLTDFVVKNFKGTIMFASNENTLEPNEELSLGVFDNIESSFNMEFANTLIEHSQKPLKLFKTNKIQNKTDQESVFGDKNTVELVFDYGDNSMTSLSNYISRSGINLLCLNRSQNGKIDSKSDIKNVINNVNVSLLVSNETI